MSVRVAGWCALVAVGALLGCSPSTGGSSAPSEQDPSPTATTEPTEADPPSPQAPSQPRAADDLLLPDMRSLPARRPQLTNGPEGRELRFDAWLANVGAGPMLVRPRSGTETCPPRQRPAVQVLYRDADGDGEFRRGVDEDTVIRQSGCMLDHPTHDHWHFDAMAAYLLRAQGASEPLVRRAKVSFCLRDNERVPGYQGGPRAYFGDCGRNLPQGISPGWVDVYDRTLDGQSLAVPDDAVGPYCLVLRADPQDRLVESDETNNTAVLGLRLRADSVEIDRTVTC